MARCLQIVRSHGPTGIGDNGKANGKSREAFRNSDCPADRRHLRSPEELQRSHSDLQRALDIGIAVASADMGTLQRLDEENDCLKIVASRGFSNDVLAFFGSVRRDTNSTCAAALTQRMRIFVGDVSTSYLFVGTQELEVLRACGVAAAHSTPLISSSGRLWGVFTIHFRKPQPESGFHYAPLDQLAVQVANSLEQREYRLRKLNSPADDLRDFMPGSFRRRDS
jgi:GAF domain-containing protein